VSIEESTIAIQRNVPKRRLQRERELILDGLILGIGRKQPRRYTGYIARYV